MFQGKAQVLGKAYIPLRTPYGRAARASVDVGLWASLHRTQVVWLEADGLYAFEGGQYGGEIGLANSSHP